MKATEWRRSAILMGNDDDSSRRAISLFLAAASLDNAAAFSRLRCRCLVAIAVMALLMAVVTIGMMPVVAMTMMISSLCVLVNDKADLRGLTMARLSMTVLPALRLRRDHDSQTAQCSQSDQSFLQHFSLLLSKFGSLSPRQSLSKIMISLSQITARHVGC
ncbi:MAG: hypothetical protein HZA59_06650 [Hydrogenophilales bacterium]|nr:hypothetical protein [Hydrogenophilales bacterium]